MRSKIGFSVIHGAEPLQRGSRCLPANINYNFARPQRMKTTTATNNNAKNGAENSSHCAVKSIFFFVSCLQKRQREETKQKTKSHNNRIRLQQRKLYNSFLYLYIFNTPTKSEKLGRVFYFVSDFIFFVLFSAVVVVVSLLHCSCLAHSSLVARHTCACARVYCANAVVAVVIVAVVVAADVILFSSIDARRRREERKKVAHLDNVNIHECTHTQGRTSHIAHSTKI